MGVEWTHPARWGSCIGRVFQQLPYPFVTEHIVQLIFIIIIIISINVIEL